jgi:hypothetical protein
MASDMPSAVPSTEKGRAAFAEVAVAVESTDRPRHVPVARKTSKAREFSLTLCPKYG